MGLAVFAWCAEALALPASPFGSAPTFASREKKQLSPFKWRVSQKEVSEPKTPDAKEKTAPSKPQIVSHDTCSEDVQCGDGSYCDKGRCVTYQPATNFLFLYYRSGDRQFTELMGIYWHQRGKSGYRVLFPFYWHFWSPSSRARVVFPFYWRFYDSDNRGDWSVSTIVPPFQVRSTPREKNYRLWPLFFWTNYGDRGAGLTVLPLFHFSREGPRRSMILPLFLSGFSANSEQQRSRGLVLGLYYWHHRKHAQTNILFPLLYRSSSEHKAFTWVFPLNFYRRNHSRRTLLLLPLHFRWSRGNSTAAFNLVPPFYYDSSPDRSRFFFLPLFFHKRAKYGYSILFPIFWRFAGPDRSLTIAGPVFHRRRGKSTTWGIFPLFLHRHLGEQKRTTFTSPLFFYEKDERASVRWWALVAPPYYRRRDRDHNIDTLFGLFWRWHNKELKTTTWVIPPVVTYSDPVGGAQVFFPIFWRFTDAPSGNATSILFPLFYRNSNPRRRTSFNLLLPFYYRGKPGGFSAGVFPLLFFGSTPGHRHAVLFPIFWHVKNPKATTTVVGPFYHRSETSGWLAGLAPLFFAGSRNGETHHVLFPLYWHLKSRKAGYNTHVLGPFFSTSSRKGRLVGLLPLFLAGHYHGKSVAAVLPPLFYRTRDRKTGDGFTLAGLYYNYQDGDERGTSIYPLFYRKHHQHKDGSSTSSTTLLPLFHHSSSTSGRKLLVTPAGGYLKDPKQGVSKGVIGPVVWSQTRDARGFAVLPLLFHWKRPKENARTTVFLPFGVWHRSPKMDADVLFPIFWRFVEPKERSLVLFPFYWRVRQQQGENADVVFPLVWRFWRGDRKLQIYGPAWHYRKGDKKSWGLVPLALYQKNQERSYLAALPFIYYRNNFIEKVRTWVVGPIYFRKFHDGQGWGVFPILFNKSRAASRYTVVAPIFWHFSNRDTDTHTTFVGPFFYRRKVARKSIGLLPLFYTGWDRAGGRTTALFPLFYYDSEMGKRALFTPLFGFERSMDRKLWYAATAFHLRTRKRTISTLVPLFFYHRNHQTLSSNLFVLPLYYGRWTTERSFHLFFPLFWRARRVDSSSTVAFPLYWDFHDRKSTRTTVIFPLFMRHRDWPARSTSWLFPGVWVRSRSDATDAVVFPLFWHFGGKRRSTTVGFPLYWDFKRSSYRTTVFFPLFWRFDKRDHTTTVVLNTYYWHGKSDDTYKFHFIPLFDVSRRRPGDLAWNVLTGLFGYERIGHNRFLRLFWAVRVKLDPVQKLPGKKAAWDL